MRVIASDQLQRLRRSFRAKKRNDRIEGDKVRSSDVAQHWKSTLAYYEQKLAQIYNGRDFSIRQVLYPQSSYPLAHPMPTRPQTLASKIHWTCSDEKRSREVALLLINLETETCRLCTTRVFFHSCSSFASGIRVHSGDARKTLKSLGRMESFKTKALICLVPLSVRPRAES